MQEQLYCEQSEFGPDYCEQSEFGPDEDGWTDEGGDSPPPPGKDEMKELLNEHRSKLQPTEVVQTFKQSRRGVTEKLNREARQASRHKYHCKSRTSIKKYSSQQQIPSVGSNGMLLIDFDEMRYETIQGTKTTPTILLSQPTLVVSGVTSADSFVKGFGLRLREKYLVDQLQKLVQPFRDAYNHWASVDQKSVFRTEQNHNAYIGFGDPANLCPACFAPDISEPEPLGYLSVDGNFQLKRRILTVKKTFLHRYKI
ncbi:hypothetical protein V1522DRAFT_393290 [Lipomyces starkeyi]